MSSDFAESKNWARVNDFTLRGPNVAGGESKLHKCLPRRVGLILRDLRLEHRIEWTGEYADEEETPEHRSKSSITARGEIESGAITVFSPGFGVVQRLGEIKTVTIDPIKKGGAGGRRNATVTNGIVFPDEEEVPLGGLMYGELGRVVYDGYAPEEGEEADGELSAYLFIEEEAFNDLVDVLRTCYADIAGVESSIVGDFFQSNLASYMGEPGLFEEVGMMISDSARRSGVSKARLESLSLRWKTQHKEVPAEVYEGGDADATEYEEASAQDRTALRIVGELKSISKFQKIATAALVLIFIVLLKEFWEL